ncbi:MAG: hypothetical protein ACI8XO_003856 [Verrucomicrobiales bacterium]
MNSKSPGSLEASLLASVNDVIDMHTSRLAAGLDRLPPPILWMLILIASASRVLTPASAGSSAGGG